MGARGRAILRLVDSTSHVPRESLEFALIWHVSVPLLLEYDVSNVRGLEGVQCGQHTSLHMVVVTVQCNGGTR